MSIRYDPTHQINPKDPGSFGGQGRLVLVDVNLYTPRIANNSRASNLLAYRNKVLACLACKRGDRIRRPLYGSDLELYTFEPLSDTIAFYIEKDIQRCISDNFGDTIRIGDSFKVSTDFDASVYRVYLPYSVTDSLLYDAYDEISFGISHMGAK